MVIVVARDSWMWWPVDYLQAERQVMEKTSSPGEPGRMTMSPLRQMKMQAPTNAL